MTRLFVAASMLALVMTAPLAAQSTTTAPTQAVPPAAQAQPAPNSVPLDQPTAVPPATPAPPTAQPSPPMQPTQAGRSAEVQTQTSVPAPTPVVDVRSNYITQLVETEFPSYDADKSGDLDQVEFGKWVLALYAKAEAANVATPMEAKPKATWAKNAFSTADVDKSKKVSKIELNRFLIG